MIFATDLDNTMIYSNNRISEKDLPNLELVERAQNNINTYMSKVI